MLHNYQKELHHSHIGKGRKKEVRSWKTKEKSREMKEIIRLEECIYIQRIMSYLELLKKDLTIYFQIFQSISFTFAIRKIHYSVLYEHE